MNIRKSISLTEPNVDLQPALNSIGHQPMSNDPIFAIVIPTRNAERHLERLLLSIQGQSCSSYSIAVVDEGSADRTVDLATSFGCTVINLPAPLFYSPPAKSRNVGAASLEGRILLHLDADMEFGTPDFLERLEGLLDENNQAVVVEERDVASGFWSKCKGLERACYRGTEMEAARAVTRDLFTKVGGYDEEISSGEDFFITKLYERATHVVRTDVLWLYHYTESKSLRSLLSKKFAYGKTAQIYLTKARSVNANTERSIVRASLIAYLRNWRLLFSRPLQYLCIFPLRAMEFVAVRLGMWVESRHLSAGS